MSWPLAVVVLIAAMPAPVPCTWGPGYRRMMDVVADWCRVAASAVRPLRSVQGGHLRGRGLKDLVT